MHQKRYVSETELLQDAYRLGVRIARSGFRPTFIVGLWRGGSTVGIAVQECLQHLGIPTDHISIRTSYRGLESYPAMVADPAAEIRVHGTQYLLDTLEREDGLLVVDDVFGSGLTMRAVLDRLESRLKRNMPREVRVAVPWYKPGRNRTDRVPDFHVNATDDWLVMPYELSGLTRDEIAENKPWMLPILDSLDRPPEAGATRLAAATSDDADAPTDGGTNDGETATSDDAGGGGRRTAGDDASGGQDDGPDAAT